ncbi:MAG: prepilin-type N-terminal cleavage/methylation domain-containing protein [Sedimentisphaerales bacterium]|nr:prepilin-type N-terminal cleavage/methylation domain-containing protein [Sedimentisphaerales bacterium]
MEPRHRPPSGFTFIEMMVVISIIVIVVSGIITVGTYVRKQAQINKAKGMIHLVVSALEEYRNYQNSGGGTDFVFPATMGSALEQMAQVPACRKILDQIPSEYTRNANKDELGLIDTILDVWGDEDDKKPLDYRDNGPGNFPTIRSCGPDQTADTADDILSDRL